MRGNRVGALLLKGEWHAAVMLIMRPRPDDEMPDISAARTRYTEHGAHRDQLWYPRVGF